MKRNKLVGIKKKKKERKKEWKKEKKGRNWKRHLHAEFNDPSSRNHGLVGKGGAIFASASLEFLSRIDCHNIHVLRTTAVKSIFCFLLSRSIVFLSRFSLPFQHPYPTYFIFFIIFYSPVFIWLSLLFEFLLFI